MRDRVESGAAADLVLPLELHRSALDAELWKHQENRRASAIAETNAASAALISVAMCLARVAAQRDVQNAMGDGDAA